MLPLNEAIGRRNAAAESSLRLIRRHLSTAPAKLRPVLRLIETHLFHPDLTIERMRRSSGVPRHDMARSFRRTTGMTPKRYLEEHRLRTAARLLRDSSLQVGQIAELVGYVEPKTFRRAFQRWAGTSPSAFRQQDGLPEAPPESRERPCFEAPELVPARRALASITNQHDGLPLPANSPVSAEDLFESLRRTGLEVGRQDRHQGLRLAEIALGVAYSTGDSRNADRRFQLAARAWAWLANARRLTLDITGAEEAFNAAEACLDTCSPNPCLAGGEVPMLRSALATYHQRFDEALQLLDTAVTRLRRFGDIERLGEALSARAQHFVIEERYERVVKDAREALALVDTKRAPYIALAARLNLVYGLFLLDRFSESEQALSKAREHCATMGIRTFEFQLQRVEGMISAELGLLEQAESKLMGCLEVFESEGNVLMTSLTVIDLAIVCSAAGCFEETRRWCGHPIFQTLGSPIAQNLERLRLQLLAAASKQEAAQSLRSLYKRTFCPARATLSQKAR